VLSHLPTPWPPRRKHSRNDTRRGSNNSIIARREVRDPRAVSSLRELHRVSLSLSLSLFLGSTDPSPRSEGDRAQRRLQDLAKLSSREPPIRGQASREIDIPRHRRDVNVSPHPLNPLSPTCPLLSSLLHLCRSKSDAPAESLTFKNSTAIATRSSASGTYRFVPSLRRDSGGVARAGWMRFPRRWSSFREVAARFARASVGRAPTPHPRPT